MDCLNQDLLDFSDFRDAACFLVRTWLDERLRELYVRSRVLGRLSESGFAGLFGFSGCSLFPGADVVGQAFVSVVRAFTSVYESCIYVHECWADCLNQDLLDYLDFRDAACFLVRMWLDKRL